MPNELLCCKTTAVQETDRHGSCRAEHFAKDTSEDLGRDLPRHAEKKSWWSQKKTFVSKQKAQLHARVDSLSSCEGRKTDKVQVCLEEKPENKQRDRNQLKVKQQQTQSAFSKLSHTCLTIVRTKERSGSPLCVLSMSFKTFQLLLLSFSSVWWWLFYDLTLIPLFEFCTFKGL